MRPSLARTLSVALLAWGVLVGAFFSLIAFLVALGVPSISATMAALFLLMALGDGAVAVVVRATRPRPAPTPEEPSSLV